MAHSTNFVGKKAFRENYLMLPRNTSAPVFFLVVIFFLLFVILLEGSIGTIFKEALRPDADWLVWLQMATVVAGISAVVAGLLVQVTRKRPEASRTQNFRNPMRWLYNLFFCALVCFAMFSGLRVTQNIDRDNRAEWERMEARGEPATTVRKAKTRSVVLSWLVGLPVVAVCGGLLWWSGGILLSGARTYWRQVSLMAYFDRDAYVHGDSVTLMLKDRRSMNSDRAYRLHLNYVREEFIRHGKNGQIVRTPLFTTFYDLAAGALHDGFQFSLPNMPEVLSYHTILDAKPYGCYWEVLIEEAGSHFYCRFFVNV